jgi:hypothetical protein
MTTAPQSLGVRTLLLPALLMVATLTLSPAAYAALGDSADSVIRDMVRLNGTDAVTQTSSYDLHEITAQSGTKVREYVSHQGAVFALSWEGRSTPDVQQLLGDSYPAYAAAVLAHRGGHHMVSVDTPDLVASVLMVQRRAVGHVQLPALIPAGVAVADLR